MLSSWQTLPVRTRSRLIPSPIIIPRATDLLSVCSLPGGSFRLCAGRSQCCKASAAIGTIGSSTARCWPSSRRVPWPRASSARVHARLSFGFATQPRVGRGGFSMSTSDAPEVTACDWVAARACFNLETLRGPRDTLETVGLVR